MKKASIILVAGFLSAFLVVGSALALPFNTRPVYTAGTTLDSLQGVISGIGSTIDVRTDQEAAAIFTNQTSGSNAAYVASLSWNATGFPFEFGIYEYGNISNTVAIFYDASDGTGVSNAGDWTTINFDGVSGTIYTEYHDAGTVGSTVLDSTNDWMDSFGFYFSWDEGNNIYYSEDDLNGATGASFLAYEANGDDVTIGTITGDDSNHWYVAMEGWGGVIDFNDIVVQLESIQPAAVPEPATMLLLGSGLIGLAGLGRKKFKRS
jgi:hypothetical protein